MPTIAPPLPELLDDELELLEDELELLLEELELEELELLDEVLGGGELPLLSPPQATNVTDASASVRGRTSLQLVKTKLLKFISSSVKTYLYFVPKSRRQRLQQPLAHYPSPGTKLYFIS